MKLEDRIEILIDNIAVSALVTIIILALVKWMGIDI